MDIAVVSFIVLGAIAISIVSFLYGKKTDSIDIQLLRAELEGQKLARREQERKYDELYDSLLRVNKYNAELLKELESKRTTYEDLGDEIYAKFSEGYSRDAICKLYPNIGYSTICSWIRKKRKEVEDSVAPIEVHPSKLF